MKKPKDTPKITDKELIKEFVSGKKRKIFFIKKIGSQHIKIACEEKLLGCSYQEIKEKGSRYYLVLTLNGKRQLWVLQVLPPESKNYKQENISTLSCIQSQRISTKLIKLGEAFADDKPTKEAIRKFNTEFTRGLL